MPEEDFGGIGSLPAWRNATRGRLRLYAVSRFQAQAFDPELPDGRIAGSLEVGADRLTFHDIDGAERYRLPLAALVCRLGGVDRSLAHFADAAQPRLEIIVPNAEIVLAEPPLAALAEVGRAVAEGRRASRRFWTFVGAFSCAGLLALAGLVAAAVLVLGWLTTWLAQ